MKRCILAIAILWSCKLLLGQGFPPNALNWPLPEGGCLGNVYDPGFHQLVRNGFTDNAPGSQWWTTKDLNGDGLPDLVVTAELTTSGYVQSFDASNTPHWLVYPNTGDGFATTPLQWSLPPGGAVYASSTPGFVSTEFTQASQAAPGCQNWTTLDMNGDSRPDLVIMAQRGTSAFAQEFSPAADSFWKVHLNTGIGFSPTASTWPLPQGGALEVFIEQGFFVTNYSQAYAGAVGSQNWSVRDMNGDRMPDLVVSGEKIDDGSAPSFGADTEHFWRVHMNTGSSFDDTPIVWSLPGGDTLEIGYASGFGSEEGALAIWGPPGSYNWYTRDLTGDGLPDLLLTAVRGRMDA